MRAGLPLTALQCAPLSLLPYLRSPNTGSLIRTGHSRPRALGTFADDVSILAHSAVTLPTKIAAWRRLEYSPLTPHPSLLLAAAAGRRGDLLLREGIEPNPGPMKPGFSTPSPFPRTMYPRTPHPTPPQPPPTSPKPKQKKKKEKPKAPPIPTLRCITFNCNGLMYARKLELQNAVGVHDPDVLMLQELKEGQQVGLQLPGYRTFVHRERSGPAEWVPRRLRRSTPVPSIGMMALVSYPTFPCGRRRVRGSCKVSILSLSSCLVCTEQAPIAVPSRVPHCSLT